MPFDLGGNLGEDKVTFESNLQSSGLWMQSVPKPIKKIEVQLRTMKHVKSGGLVIIARKIICPLSQEELCISVAVEATRMNK